MYPKFLAKDSINCSIGGEVIHKSQRRLEKSYPLAGRLAPVATLKIELIIRIGTCLDKLTSFSH